MSTKSKAYYEGVKACNEGKSLLSNPYPILDQTSKDWQQGWRECQREWNTKTYRWQHFLSH